MRRRGSRVARGDNGRDRDGGTRIEHHPLSQAPSRVALIGAGRWGQRLLRVLVARAEVVAVAHHGGRRTAEKLQAEWPSLRVTQDVSALMRDPTIDGVVIATPVASHAALVRDALEWNKHVLVEKPLATSALEAESLAELALEQGRVLIVGHTWTYHEAFVELRRLVGSTAVHACFDWRKFGSFTENIFDNLLTHDVALALELFDDIPGKVEILSARGRQEAADVVLVRLVFDGDRDAVIRVDRISPVRSKSASVITSERKVVSWLGDDLYVAEDSNPFDKRFTATTDALSLEIGAFLNAIAGDLSGRPARAVEIVRVIEEIKRAAASAT